MFCVWLIHSLTSILRCCRFFFLFSRCVCVLLQSGGITEIKLHGHRTLQYKNAFEAPMFYTPTHIYSTSSHQYGKNTERNGHEHTQHATDSNCVANFFPMYIPLWILSNFTLSLSLRLHCSGLSLNWRWFSCKIVHSNFWHSLCLNVDLRSRRFSSFSTTVVVVVVVQFDYFPFHGWLFVFILIHLLDANALMLSLRVKFALTNTHLPTDKITTTSRDCFFICFIRNNFRLDSNLRLLWSQPLCNERVSKQQQFQ